VSRLAAENGDTPEKAQLDMLKYTSQYHSGMLQNMMDGNPEQARAYMNKFGAQMLPAARGQFVKSLEIAERNVKVLGEVSTAMGTAQSETEALSMVREKFATDADGMKLAVQEVKSRFKEQEEATQQAQKQAFDRAWTIAVEQGKGRRGVDAQTLSMLTPQQRDSIDDEMYQRTERVIVAQDRAESKREKQNTDAAWENYYAIRQQARDNPQAFKNRDLREDFRNIPKEKREELIDLQAKRPDELADVTALDKQIGLTVGTLGITDANKYKFESVIRDAVTTEQKKQGKPLGEESRQKIIDRMVIEGEVPGGAWYKDDKEGRAYEFYGKPEANKFIPSDDAIKQRFEKNKGRAPTSEELKAIKANLANKG
jgi:membrane-associated HD superfamily phosphohydrolase